MWEKRSRWRKKLKDMRYNTPSEIERMMDKYLDLETMIV